MIGSRIKQLRERRELTQAELSIRIGVNINTLAAYERGTREPNIEKICLFANFFGVTSDYLLGLSDCQNLEDAQCLQEKYDELSALLKETDSHHQQLFLKFLGNLIDCYKFILEANGGHLIGTYLKHLKSSFEHLLALCATCNNALVYLEWEKLTHDAIIKVVSEYGGTNMYHSRSVIKNFENLTEIIQNQLLEKAVSVYNSQGHGEVSSEITFEELEALSHEKTMYERRMKIVAGFNDGSDNLDKEVI